MGAEPVWPLEKQTPPITGGVTNEYARVTARWIMREERRPQHAKMPKPTRIVFVTFLAKLFTLLAVTLVLQRGRCQRLICGPVTHVIYVFVLFYHRSVVGNMMYFTR